MIDKEIIKIASNTENHGVLDNHTHFSKLKNSICGDVMRVYLIVKDNKVGFEFLPKTKIEDGIPKFIEWYQSYHYSL